MLLTMASSAGCSDSSPRLLVVSRVWICYAHIISTRQACITRAGTYTDQKVRVATMEIRDLEHIRQCLLECERPIELAAELLFHAKRLENEDTHANDALFGRIILGFDSIVQD